MSEPDITSPSNQRIKRLLRLRDRHHRDAEGVFIVEGDRSIARALNCGLQPVELYVSPDHPDAGNATTVAAAALDRASYRGKSQGAIAVFEQFSLSLGDFRPADRPLILVAESVEKPGNLGAILRTADAVGATGLVTIGPGVDFFSPNVVRSSVGALFTVPLAHAKLEDLEAWLRRHRIPLVVATPSAPIPYWEGDYTVSVAIAVGAEHSGVTDSLLHSADTQVSIPMQGAVDSLNTAVSLALISYEALRQRMTGR